MYTIVKGKDDKYHCEGMLQDGHENWVTDTLSEAVDSIKLFAKVMNHTKIKKKDITFLQEVHTTESKLVAWRP